jgi:hypothetical protein
MLSSQMHELPVFADAKVGNGPEPACQLTQWMPKSSLGVTDREFVGLRKMVTQI